MTTASHTCVLRPRCWALAHQKATAPSVTVAQVMLFSSMVVNDAPAWRQVGDGGVAAAGVGQRHHAGGVRNSLGAMYGLRMGIELFS